MSAPAVSIVVPVYNPGRWLQPLIDSLLAQSEPSLEIIAVDDGSTDGSTDVLRATAALDARFIVVTQRNGGHSAARNAGLDRARGRWIAFADSDDWLQPTAIATWRQHGEQANLEMVLGNGYYLSDEAANPKLPAAGLVVTVPPPTGVFTGKQWIEHCVARSAWNHFVWLQFVRREVLLQHKLRFEEGVRHEDVLWTLSAALCLHRIGYVAEPLYGYRIHPAAFSQDRSVALLQDRARSYLVVISRLVEAAESRRQERTLRLALMRHAYREVRNLHHLMRSNILTIAMRRELAREFFRLKLTGAIFKGAYSFRMYWRGLRMWFRLRFA